MSEIYDAKLRSDRILLDLVGDKWTVLVFGSLCDHGGRRRFNAIRRDIPGISQKSLTQCLRRLERNGLLRRHVYTKAGGMAVEYAFTELGRPGWCTPGMDGGEYRCGSPLSGRIRTEPRYGRRRIGESRQRGASHSMVSGYSPPCSMVSKRSPVPSICGSCGGLSGV
jgi:DNA-binding HxlR family transcriptional regulator